MEAAFETSRRISHSGSIGQIHYFAGVFFADLRRDPIALEHHLDAMIAFDREHGFSAARNRVFPGHVAVRTRQASRWPRACGTSPRPDVALMAEKDAHIFLVGWPRHLRKWDSVDQAWQTIVEAQSMCERTAEHSWDAELHRIAGEILFVKGADAGDVEARFQQAIRTARQQGAKSLELRAALSFARLLIGQGRVAEARDLLAPIYAWFTEGFETADLREARAVLAELGTLPTARVHQGNGERDQQPAIFPTAKLAEGSKRERRRLNLLQCDLLRSAEGGFVAC